jgi:transposase
VQVRALLPDQQSLRLEEIEHDKENQRVIIRVQSVSKTCACPKCKGLSGRVHSRYQRKLTDLPWQGLFVHMAWITRRFFCDVEECSQKIFTERLAAVAAPYSRRTERLSLAIRCIAFACSGEPGARLAERLGMQISADSLLREIRKSFKVQDSTPRALGVDDWAFCKGQTYGTLLCDLESGRAVELLSDRDADSFAVWLENHKGVEIISRDRGDIYRKGATNGAPDALQVADRFHLMKNLRDAFARFLDGQSQQIRSAVKQFDQAVSTDAKPELEPDKPPIETKAQKQTAARRDRRLAIYNQVVELHRQGKSARSIAKQMGIHRSTVRLYLRADSFPERAARNYSRQTDPFKDHLRERWKSGCCNATALWKEIAEQGFKGSYHSVRRLVGRWKKPAGTSRRETSDRKVSLSPNQTSWLLFKHEYKLAAEEVELKGAVLDRCSEIRSAWQLVRRFVVMLRKRKGRRLEHWYAMATQQDVPASIRQFAEGLKNDWAAVTAALTFHWNNGSAEGHISRLKMIKRQMYGRANFDLLRARFLFAS